jgi:hypothetical protein
MESVEPGHSIHRTKRVNLLPIARASTRSILPFGQEEESIGFAYILFVLFTTRKNIVVPNHKSFPLTIIELSGRKENNAIGQ